MKLKYSLLMFGLMFGCTSTSTLRFQAVDGRSGTPIPGVVVVQNSTEKNILDADHFTRTLKPSDERGMIAANKVPTNWSNEFTFSKDGYKPALAIYTRTDRLLGRLPVYSPKGDDAAKEWVQDPTKVIRVPMEPVQLTAE
jgi:hypothetical protein